jgi:hypothetical protein
MGESGLDSNPSRGQLCELWTLLGRVPNHLGWVRLDLAKLAKSGVVARLLQTLASDSAWRRRWTQERGSGWMAFGTEVTWREEKLRTCTVRGPNGESGPGLEQNMLSGGLLDSSGP